MMKELIKAFLFASSCALLSIFTGHATAATPNNSNTVPVKIELHNHTFKIIHLFKVNLSHAQKHTLTNSIKLALRKSTHQPMAQLSHIPSKRENNMNNIPVLDQGAWGTCATFATTAAVDAFYALQKDQKISQLCHLELSRTLNIPNAEGGWNGSYGNIILQQINEHGYITQQYEHEQGCGGLKNYPMYDTNNGSAMPTADFEAASNKQFTKHNWKTILKPSEDLPISPARGQRVLSRVKHAIAHGNRIVFGSMLDIANSSTHAVGRYDNIINDTWVLTPEIQQDINDNIIGGHEMIITGYDDNACADYTLEDGSTQKQCGLLHLRNSWSEEAGDHGDFYMSYDYFKALIIEAYIIGR